MYPGACLTRQSTFPFLVQYNDGVPDDSRLAVEQEAQFKRKIEFLKSPEGQRQIAIIRKLSEFAEKGASPLSTLVLNLSSSCAVGIVPLDPTHCAPCTYNAELDCKVSQLALAWVARNTNTSSVILGASKPEQVLDNLKALEVIPKLTPDVLAKIDEIVGNKPAPWVRTASNSSACWVEGLTKGWRY